MATFPATPKSPPAGRNGKPADEFVRSRPTRRPLELTSHATARSYCTATFSDGHRPVRRADVHPAISRSPPSGRTGYATRSARACSRFGRTKSDARNCPAAWHPGVGAGKCEHARGSRATCAAGGRSVRRLRLWPDSFPQTLAWRARRINLHGSLLPKYRGAPPVQWAVYHGETQTGVSVIHMTPRLDAGPVLVQRSTPIGPAETAADLEPRLAAIGAEAVAESIQLLAAGQQSPGIPQDAAIASNTRGAKRQMA